VPQLAHFCGPPGSTQAGRGWLLGSCAVATRGTITGKAQTQAFRITTLNISMDCVIKLNYYHHKNNCLICNKMDHGKKKD